MTRPQSAHSWVILSSAATLNTIFITITIVREIQPTKQLLLIANPVSKVPYLQDNIPTWPSIWATIITVHRLVFASRLPLAPGKSLSINTTNRRIVWVEQHLGFAEI